MTLLDNGQQFIDRREASETAENSAFRSPDVALIRAAYLDQLAALVKRLITDGLSHGNGFPSCIQAGVASGHGIRGMSRLLATSPTTLLRWHDNVARPHELMLDPVAKRIHEALVAEAEAERTLASRKSVARRPRGKGKK